jgi:hypothetical protein
MRDIWITLITVKDPQSNSLPAVVPAAQFARRVGC